MLNGVLDGGIPYQIPCQFLKNGNVACRCIIPLLNLRKGHVTCHYDLCASVMLLRPPVTSVLTVTIISSHAMCRI